MNAYKRFAVMLIAVLIFTCCFSSAVFAATGEKITLSAWDRTESLAFRMTNMAPGDSETKAYAITINDKRAVSLRFSIEPRELDEMLAEVLHIKVEQDSDILYSGILDKMPDFTVNLSGKMPKTVNFRITVSLDTSVGNEYMGKMLSADFNWSIEREPYVPKPPVETTATTHITPVETTTATSMTETAEPTTTESSFLETTAEQTSETTAEQTTTAFSAMETTTETTSFYEETTTSIEPPIPTKPCCECCVGYGFPYSCNFGSFGGDDIGCDLPWCCAGGNGCHCPWCWIIPLIILIALIIAMIVVSRKLTKKDEKDEEEESADEQKTK